MAKSKETKERKYLNPYVGGVLLGIVLLAANFVAVLEARNDAAIVHTPPSKETNNIFTPVSMINC